MAKTTMLIADSGSTKTGWCLLEGSSQQRIKTQGISPYFLNADQIKAVLAEELIPQLACTADTVTHVFFYGTGLSAPANAQQMETLLKGCFPAAAVSVYHDLMGAARALCQREKGLACILGTGSGACYYDGVQIVKSSPGLGFILGDEGSGAYMGKMLVQRYLYGTLDNGLAAAFEARYQPTKADILQRVYQGAFPNRYLAEFARFLGAHRGEVAAEEIIKTGIRDFLTQHVAPYVQRKDVPVHFVGGIADAFQDVVTRLSVRQGFRPGRILSKPMDGLITYHNPETGI